MQKKMTATEIGALLKVSERTIARRVELPVGNKRRIDAQKLSDGAYLIDERELRRHMPISEEDLEKLLSEVGEMNLEEFTQLKMNSARLEANSARLERIEERLLAIEFELRQLAHHKHEPEPPELTEEDNNHVPEELPEGTMSLIAFAAQHGVTRSTVLGQIANQRYLKLYTLDHEKYPIPNRKGAYKRYVTPAQQEAFRKLWSVESPG